MPSTFLYCAGVFLVAVSTSVVAAASEHRDNPNFKTRLGIPCFTIALGNLDCDQFGLLGMTEQEVLELKDNCPCACNDIKCGEEKKKEAHGTKPSPLIKEAGDDGYIIHEVSIDQTEDQQMTENTAPVASPTKAPSFLPTAAPTYLPTRAPTNNPSLRPNPSLTKGKEEEAEAATSATPATPEEPEEDVVDLLQKEPTRDEQPATTSSSSNIASPTPEADEDKMQTFPPTRSPTNNPSLRSNPSLTKGKEEEAEAAAPATPATPAEPEEDVVDLLQKEPPATTSSSIVSPTSEADEDKMPITPYDQDENGTFSIPTANNSDAISKTAVKFIVCVAMISAAFVAFHIYKKYGGKPSSDKEVAQSKSEKYSPHDDSDGTISRDGSSSNVQSDASSCEDPVANVGSTAMGEEIQWIEP